MDVDDEALAEAAEALGTRAKKETIKWHSAKERRGSAGPGRLSLAHYDRDFDQIAAVTGQPMRWLAPAGSIK